MILWVLQHRQLYFDDISDILEDTSHWWNRARNMDPSSVLLKKIV
jgi:hypothetical protein